MGVQIFSDYNINFPFLTKKLINILINLQIFSQLHKLGGFHQSLESQKFLYKNN